MKSLAQWLRHGLRRSFDFLGGRSSGRHILENLSRQTGLDDHYVSRILKCAFLAPDIVDAIPDGRQLADFNRAGPKGLR